MTRICSLLLSLLLLNACGPSPADIDPAPFRSAMEADFAKRKYGVALGKISDIQIQGETASLKVRVTHKASTGMKPQWSVTFKKAGQRWVVDKIKRK